MKQSITSPASRHSFPEETTVSVRFLDHNFRGERENLPKLHWPRMILMF